MGIPRISICDRVLFAFEIFSSKSEELMCINYLSRLREYRRVVVWLVLMYAEIRTQQGAVMVEALWELVLLFYVLLQSPFIPVPCNLCSADFILEDFFFHPFDIRIRPSFSGLCDTVVMYNFSLYLIPTVAVEGVDNPAAFPEKRASLGISSTALGFVQRLLVAG